MYVGNEDTGPVTEKNIKKNPFLQGVFRKVSRMTELGGVGLQNGWLGKS